MSTEVIGFNKGTLLEMLHCRVVSVKFRKVNGDIRHMRCTLMAEMLPETKKEKIEEQEVEKVVHPNIVTVYDLDNKDWRSIRTDRILEVL